MANGFSQGYFGIQVNSATERRILFSVWSGFDTNIPGEVPEAYRVELQSSGPGVITGAFGGEGSGGQSYLVFDWKANTTYGFLTRAQPNSGNSTSFTAWFN